MGASSRFGSGFLSKGIFLCRFYFELLNYLLSLISREEYYVILTLTWIWNGHLHYNAGCMKFYLIKLNKIYGWNKGVWFF